MSSLDKGAALGQFGCAAVALLAVGLLLMPAHTDPNTNGPAHHHEDTVVAGLGRVAVPDFASDMADVNARMHAAMAVTPSGDADRDFLHMMIPHHQGAIDMARVFLKYGRDERLKRLAQSIIVEQGQEIAYMQTLLAAHPPAEASNPNPMTDR